jgi:hypothetical protein
VGHIGQVASGLARLKQTADENEFGRFQEKKMKMKNGDGLGLPGKSGRNWFGPPDKNRIAFEILTMAFVLKTKI